MEVRVMAQCVCTRFDALYGGESARARAYGAGHVRLRTLDRARDGLKPRANGARTAPTAMMTRS